MAVPGISSYNRNKTGRMQVVPTSHAGNSVPLPGKEIKMESEAEMNRRVLFRAVGRGL